MIAAEALNQLSRKDLLDLIEMTSRWATNEDHKFYLYKPAPVLYYYHTDPAKCRVVLGGNRSSKTYSLVEEFAMQFTSIVPPSLSGLIPPHRLERGRRLRLETIDYPNNFMKVVWPLCQTLIPDDKIETVLREQGRIKAIVNSYGGFMEFMQYEQDVKKHQGSSRHVIGYDEEPPKSIRDENLMRLADTNGEECFALTPVSEIDRPIIWIYDELYEKASRIVEKEDGVLTDVSQPEGDPDIHVFFSNIFDNPAMNREAAERILSKFPAEERTVREKGKFLFMSGRIYKEYSDTTHLVPQFKWWERDVTLYLAIDTHPRTPTAVLFLAIDRYENIWLVDELFTSLSIGLKKFVDLVKAKCMGIVPELILIEPGAYTVDPSTQGCLAYDLIEAGLNNPMPMPAPKDLAGGIINAQEYLTVPRDENGQIVSPPKVRITRHMTRFRHEITHYVWDYWKKDTALTKGEKQKPVDKDDHFMECMYRLLLMRPRYIPQQRSEDEHEYIPKAVGRSAHTGY